MHGCPWESRHSKGERCDSSTVLFAPDAGEGQTIGYVHCSHVPLRSKRMPSWIARTVCDRLGQCVGANAIDEALVALEGIARFDCDERPIYLRVAEHEGAIYVDLADETGECVEATADGWRIRGEAPLMCLDGGATRSTCRCPRPGPRAPSALALRA